MTEILSNPAMLGIPYTGPELKVFLTYQRNEFIPLTLDRLLKLDPHKYLYKFVWYTRSYNAFVIYHEKDSFNDSIRRYRIDITNTDKIIDLMEILNNDDSKDEIRWIPLKDLMEILMLKMILQI